MHINRNKLVDLSYILSIALLISSIIYFFAANWPGFGRVTKISLSVGLIVLFYGLSLALARILKQRKLVSALMLFAGCLSFGVGVALLGQIYNSHADSYMLFLVWFVPAFLFSLLTRYQSFYVLSYLLLHLGIWFLLFPSTIIINYSEEMIVLSFLVLAGLNACLFFLILRGMITSKPLTLLSLLVFHILFIPLTNSFLFENYGFLFNFVYLPILFWQMRYFMKQEERSYVFLVGIAAFTYAFMKYIELSIRYFSEGFFLLALLFVIVIIVGNVYLLKWITRRVKEGQRSALWGKLLVGLTTAVSTLIATFSIMGYIALMIGDFPAYFYLFIAVCGFILPMMYAKSVAPTVRYTLLFIGYTLGISSAWDLHFLVNIAFAVLIGTSWVVVPNRYVRSVAYLAGNVHLMLSLFWVDTPMEIVFLLLLIANALLCGLGWFRRESSWSKILYQNSLVYSLFFFFVLTFVNSQWSIMYYVYNAFFFILVTFLAFWAVKQEKRYESIVSLVFWFAFLAYKYYDLLWKLLHKSIALCILGLLFLGVAIWLDKKFGKRVARGKPSIIWAKLPLISLVILLQFTILGVQIAKSEYILAMGETIKLELVPVDPRSLIQGDYVILRYAISTLNIHEDLYQHENVQVVLAPNEQGVYEYTGVFKYKGKFNREYVPAADEVLINARYDGRRGFIYGIESFFVPEGTGRQVEREAKFAYVQVGSNGDAILMRLSAE